VVIGNSSLEQYWLAYLRREYQTFTNRVNFTWSNDLSLAEVLSKAARLPPQTSIFYFLLTVDARGEPHVQGQALAALHEVANAPIFGFGDYELGHGIVGGPLNPTDALGRQAANVAVRILKGKALSAVCSKEIHSHCTGVQDMRGQFLACLYAHQANLSRGAKEPLGV